MLDPLWLLLPVAAASGWWAARRSQKRSDRRVREFSSDYFKGLNYLLNEQPDKAIEVFIRLVEVDSETVETHLALGNLFRRRGEVDRAIRIHQNLIARPTLDREQRALGLLELGADYMRAGLFDRAESLFQELIDMNAHAVAALVNLIDIYQQEKDWDKGIQALHRLEHLTGESKDAVVAQYYCEMAEQARAHGDTEAAMQRLKRALRADPQCVRATLIQGDMAVVRGDCRTAVNAYRHVEEQNADFLPEVLAPLQACYQKLGKPEAMFDYLRQIVARHHGISPMLALAEMIRARDGDRAAADFITQELRARPSVRGLERLIEINIGASDAVDPERLSVLGEIASQLLENKPVYKCRHCGFAGKVMHWQCPSCKNWNSVQPIQGVEGE
jgi:lipopolysaccharide biosynthesis regulator YciM